MHIITYKCVHKREDKGICTLPNPELIRRSGRLLGYRFFSMRRAVCLELTSCVWHRKRLTVFKSTLKHSHFVGPLTSTQNRLKPVPLKWILKGALQICLLLLLLSIKTFKNIQTNNIDCMWNFNIDAHTSSCALEVKQPHKVINQHFYVPTLHQILTKPLTLDMICGADQRDQVTKQ